MDLNYPQAVSAKYRSLRQQSEQRIWLARQAKKELLGNRREKLQF